VDRALAVAVRGGLPMFVPLVAVPDRYRTVAAAVARVGLLGLYLVGIAVPTLPHVAVVTWVDARQGVWRVPDRTGRD